MDYTIFYKKKYENSDIDTLIEELDFDFFISAYNESERITTVFDKINSTYKHWIILPEYKFSEVEISHLSNVKFDYSEFSFSDDEGEIILDYYSQNEELFKLGKIGVDITGFLRPHLVFLIRLLKEKNISKVDFIYSEPVNYKKKEETLFSEDYYEIREIKGCLNSHNPETTNDLLILGSGYDYQMVSKVAKFKADTKKVQVLGFPPLQADMFQENILKVYQAEEDVSSGQFSLDSEEIILSPANDPFVTAQLISEFVKREQKQKELTNIYLCPISTKAHTLGIALYYINECLDKPVSIIFPFSKKYSRETSEGISKIWIYKVEL
ncbi:hypothetical protein [Flavobacterium columnare]|uniref:Uncharacterized protein n=1 Tax=Flavobacterium columnare TaxID=996 RepID=A0AAI8GBQ3_9FLAO|nr:hypothetical protein [Flavobacterium columnare]AMO20733.1 hypothetical protein UN65_10645 [Flavobacterium columnare]AUX18714.1 hypothetical protein AQ623_10805 [Flavobacterium columnare]QOG57797.1 hypothetical protein HUE29_10710 [Flavobacterium columnare]QOG60521.1 hypothetical protein HUE30_10710 [Flavobacterium columnare]QOG63241.1 hypothetical protein HUE31_10710 [Flavobacterium columnare]